MPKDILFDVQEKLRIGIGKLTDAVAVTLGPTGRVVMIARDFGDPIITKDGITVAKHIELSDPVENMAAQVVRQVTQKTAAAAGDGTTTATIYANAIYEAGLKYATRGSRPIEMKRGIERAITTVCSELAQMARPVTKANEIKQVASCSANHDAEVGAVIAQAMDAVGQDGVVTIEEGRSLNTTVAIVDGYQFSRGYLSQYFVNNPDAMLYEQEKPFIMLCDDRITSVKEIMPVLELISKSGKPLVIIADDIDAEPMNLIIVNTLKKVINVVVVKAPGFGDRKRETLDDLAAITGAAVVSKISGVKLENVKINDFGSCDKIRISRDETIIIKGIGTPENVESRINLIKTQLEAIANDFDKEKLQERLAKLRGGVAQIIVGGATEIEVREKKDRIDDALHACKAATEEGILPGGGVAVLRTIDALDRIVTTSTDEKFGVEIVKKALQAPLRKIAENTGEDGGAIISKVMEHKNPNYGYDAASGRFGDMIEFGIIVPTKVERVALQNAASVASLLLSTDCLIFNTPDVKPAGEREGVYPGA